MDEKLARYLLTKKYPEDATNGMKANIRKQAKLYEVDGSTIYHSLKGKRLQVVRADDEQQAILAQVHQGKGNTAEDVAMAGHVGINKTTDLIVERYYWKGMVKSIQDFITKCEHCQKVNAPSEDVRPKLHPVKVPMGSMRKVGIDVGAFA